ncbi:hypothetical protein C8J57DRAFT_1600502 [Mycena rebaudengoi]|nr:hypothetical protein C8J57DRAFT_1600502 [Mycena rebaudengoi]
MAPFTRAGGRKRILALGPVNTTGLASLPVETLREIISHFETIPVPCSLSMARTCRRLRSVLVVLAYERLESCASFKISDKRMHPGYYGRQPHELTKELIRQVEIVTIRDPSLAQIVTAVLFDLSSATVFPEFVQGLSAMPNLETIQLLYVERHARKHKSLDPPTRLANELRGRLFASVRTLVIPMAALELVECCPQIEHLTIDDTVPYAIRPDVVPKIAAQAKQLRVFRCRSIPGHCLKDLVQGMPLLEEMPSIYTYQLRSEDLYLLKGIKNLANITLDARIGTSREFVEIAKQILRSSDAQMPKEVLVIHNNNRDQTSYAV